MNKAKNLEPTKTQKTIQISKNFGKIENEGFLTPSPMKHIECPHETELTHVLLKGKYDIHYVITLIKVILQKKPHFGLQQSLMRLLAMLEVERDQMNARNEKMLNIKKGDDIIL